MILLIRRLQAPAAAPGAARCIIDGAKSMLSIALEATARTMRLIIDLSRRLPTASLSEMPCLEHGLADAMLRTPVCDGPRGRDAKPPRPGGASLEPQQLHREFVKGGLAKGGLAFILKLLSHMCH